MTSSAPCHDGLATALDLVDIGPGRARVGSRSELTGDRADLEPQLARHLYDELHAGLAERELTNAMLRSDGNLVASLLDVVPHATAPATAVLLRADHNSLLVEWDGVRVHVPRDRAPDSLPAAGETVTLRVAPARPGLSPGFQFVTGSRGASFGAPPLRVYVHLDDPWTAVPAWSAVLGRLESGERRYHAKVLTCPAQYPRRDALVVYLPTDDDAGAALVADAVDGMASPPVSVLAERISTGVARAWEPADTRFGFTGLSFGQHRTRVLARALLLAAETGVARAEAIDAEFRAASIDPARPARNLAGGIGT